MPLTLAPPPIEESLDKGELVIPAPSLAQSLHDTPLTVMAPAPANFTLPALPTIESGDGNVFATIIAVLLGIWVAKMILGLIPRFILIGIGVAILYAYIK